jgi:tetratricopeptide (TPR) repeat protein
MSHDHLTWPKLLTLIRRCEVTDQLMVKVLVRSTEVCDRCREGAGEFAEMIASGEVDSADLSPFTVGLAHSRRRVAQIWPEIEPLDPRWARRRLAREPARWAMVERLVERSVELAASDPEAALATADLAVEVAERLPVLHPEEPYPEDMDEVPFDEDAQLEALALAYAARGNAYRVSERYLLAEQEFQRADRLQVEMPTLGFYARLLSLRASLHYDRRRFGEALECLEDAEVLVGESRAADEDRLRLRQQRIMILVTNGELLRAVDLTAANLRAYPPQKATRLSIAVLQLHVDVLSRLGEIEQAQCFLPQLNQLVQSVGTPSDALQVLWVEARIDFEAGEYSSSLERFSQVGDAWLQAGLADRWSLVTMERALVHLAMGNTEEVRNLAQAALPNLITLAASPDVFAIFKILAEAAAIDAEKVRALIRKLECLTTPRAPGRRLEV